MTIGHEQIAAMIPHADTMCLIDTVLSWSPAVIRCLSRCHRHRDNPLRRADGTLGAACGIELAAQAMAIHGYLTASGSGLARPAQGYLANVRDVRLWTARLDRIESDLVIEAELLMGDASCAAYRFALGSESAKLLGGRATVLLGIKTA